MSDEEKKAIEYFKSNLEMTKEMGKKWGFQEEIKNNEILLNLIEKQSKEIEEAEQKERKAYIKGTNDADELCNKMWKNKIKAKIEEEDELFFKTKDVRHANRYKAYKELLEKE